MNFEKIRFVIFRYTHYININPICDHIQHSNQYQCSKPDSAWQHNIEWLNLSEPLRATKTNIAVLGRMVELVDMIGTLKKNATHLKNWNLKLQGFMLFRICLTGVHNERSFWFRGNKKTGPRYAIRRIVLSGKPQSNQFQSYGKFLSLAVVLFCQ